MGLDSNSLVVLIECVKVVKCERYNHQKKHTFDILGKKNSFEMRKSAILRVKMMLRVVSMRCFDIN